MKTEQVVEKIITISLTLLLLVSQAPKVFAQADTIRVKDKRLITQALKPGLKQYLVYYQNPKDPRRLNLSLWLRNITLENRDGEKLFAITQHWYGADTTSYRAVYSLNKATDFSPVYHSETIGKKTKAYNWYPDKINGADTVADNMGKAYALDFKQPNFNWNLDIETFEMLPLAAGKSFVIPFYEAGIDAPLYVLYKVTGSEVITTAEGNKADCWKLYNESDYKGRHFTETYWISKKNHEFLKEEDSFNGGYRYKIKMIGAAPDLLERFVR
jgi:hypothetical protein